MNQQEAATWRLLSFPLYLVHRPTLFGPAAALFLLSSGMAGIELVRACAIVAGICLALVLFLTVDRRALELSGGLRKRMSDATLETRRVATVGVDRVVRIE
jgi:peptidoglycan/LPS O-acetylase OafA/YrhL